MIRILYQARYCTLALLTLLGTQGFACSPGAVNLSKLHAEADVIAIGTVRLFDLRASNVNGERSIKGRVVLEDVLISKGKKYFRTQISFPYEYVESEGCVFGIELQDRSRVRVYLKRKPIKGATFSSTYMEVIAE